MTKVKEYKIKKKFFLPHTEFCLTSSHSYARSTCLLFHNNTSLPTLAGSRKTQANSTESVKRRRDANQRPESCGDFVVNRKQATCVKGTKG